AWGLSGDTAARPASGGDSSMTLSAMFGSAIASKPSSSSSSSSEGAAGSTPAGAVPPTASLPGTFAVPCVPGSTAGVPEAAGSLAACEPCGSPPGGTFGVASVDGGVVGGVAVGPGSLPGALPVAISPVDPERPDHHVSKSLRLSHAATPAPPSAKNVM